MWYKHPAVIFTVAFAIFMAYFTITQINRSRGLNTYCLAKYGTTGARISGNNLCRHPDNFDQFIIVKDFK